MTADKKPQYISDEEWKEIKALAPEMQKVLLSLRASSELKCKCEKEKESPVKPAVKSAKIIQLPLWPEPQRASPNAFLRSAVFPAIQGKNRRYMKNELIFAQAGYEIRFTGQQLDQSDFDVWLQAAHFARCSPLGTEVSFTGRGFLKSIGRTGGGKDIEWLKSSLARLQTSMVEIKIGLKWLRLNLLTRTSGDDQTTAIVVKFDPILIQMFASDNWTALQWAERHCLKGKPLALWLHGYYSSHASPYPIKVKTLQSMCGSETKDIRFFKRALGRAFEKVEEAAGIKGTIDGDLVTVERTPSPTQARHLIKKSRRKIVRDTSHK